MTLGSYVFKTMYQHFLLIKKKYQLTTQVILGDQEVLEAIKGSLKCSDFYELVAERNFVKIISISSLAYTVFSNQRISALIIIPSVN